MTVEMPLPPVGTEALDARDLDAELAEVTLREIAVTNTLFGGHAALRHGLRAITKNVDATKPLTVLDVGAGDGQAAERARRAIGAERTTVVGLDHHLSAGKLCQQRPVLPVVGDMWDVPFSRGSVDIVIMSLVLHHVTREDALQLIAALDRVTTLGVVIADLRRSVMATAAFAVASRALRFHEVTRRDGHVSIQRGFTEHELGDLIRHAGVSNATVGRRLGWRLVAYWKKVDAHTR